MLVKITIHRYPLRDLAQPLMNNFVNILIKQRQIDKNFSRALVGGIALLRNEPLKPLNSWYEGSLSIHHINLHFYLDLV